MNGAVYGPVAPGLRRAVGFVVAVDARLFCLRHRLEWGTRGLLGRLGAALLTVLVLGPPFAVVLGYLVGGWSAGEGLSTDALSGAVLGVLAVQAAGRLLSGAARGTRIGLFSPPDAAVLRAFDVPVSAVLAVRFAAGTVVRQLLVAVLAGGVLLGLHVAGGGGAKGPVVLTGLVLPLGAAAGACLLAGMRPVAAQPGSGWLLGAGALAAGSGVAAGLAADVAVAAVPATPLSEPQQVELLDVIGTGLLAGVGGYGLPVTAVVLGLIAAAAAARFRRDPARGVPVPRRTAAGGPRGRDRVRPVLIVPIAMLRSAQGAVEAFRHACRVIVLVGVFLLAAGFAAPGLIPRFESALPGFDGGRDPLLAGSGGGLVLVVGVLVAAFVATVCGPRVLAGPLRWRWEQGTPARAVAATHLLGMLLVVAPPVVLCGAAMGLLLGDATLLGYAISLAVGAVASSAAGDLTTGGRQGNPDGTADLGAEGAVTGVLALVAVQAPWLLLPGPAVVLGPAVAVVLFVVTGCVLARRVAS